MSAFVDITGWESNGITVIKDDSRGQKGCNRTVLARCHCGKEFRVWKHVFKGGGAKSCGCKSRIVGRKIGSAIVLSKQSPDRVLLKCDCGNIFSRTSNYVYSHPKRLNCGCKSKHTLNSRVVACIDGREIRMSESHRILGVSRSRVYQLFLDGKLEGRLRAALSND